MITLATGGTLKGKAGTATAISYTLSGDAVTTTDTFQVLGQGQLASSTGDLLSTTPVPSSTSYLIKEIHGSNTTASNVSGITFYVNGSGSGNIIWQGSCPAGGSFVYDDSGWHVYDSNGVVQSVGSTGPSGTITVGTVTNIGTTGPPTVVNAGTSTAAVFNFGLQQGATGSTGAPGAVNTIASANSTIAVTGTTNTNLERAALTGDVTASSGSNATTLAAGSASNLNSGTLLAARMPALTGDITTSAGAVATTLATVNTVTPGTFGSATAVPTITVNGKGLTTASSSTAIQIAESQVTSLTSDLAAKQPLDSDLTTIAALTPNIGQKMEYSTTGWLGVTSEYDVTAFGADPSGSGDSTLGIYNAIISCMIVARVQTTSNATTGSTFTLSVQANIIASTGTLHAQTTTGLIGFTYTGGGSTSLSCTVTYGVTGGTILSGSLVGFNNSIVNGGIVNIPAGFYVTTFPIINSIPGIWFKGAGGSTTHDTGAWPSGGGSFISQRGSVQGLDVLVNMPISGNSGVQGGQSLGGIRITGLSADCTNANGYMWCRSGFVMLSTTGEYMEDLFVYNASLTAYRFSTLGASMLSEAADQTRGTHINLRFRQLEGKSTAANISAAGLTNPAATTNLNALSASTVTVSGAPNANWDTSGMAKFQAVDQLTGNVCWYLVAYTGISGSTLTGCTAIAQLPNETNSTTLNAATPASGNFKPNAVMFAGSRIVPAQGAFGDGITWHGSATANACCGLWQTLVGTYFMGTALYSANSDSQKIVNPVFNRTTAGTPTGIGVELHGSTLSGASGASGSTRNQYFIGGDPGLGGITVRGTDTLGYLQPASTNKWDYYELGNGAPVPISGTNAHFIWSGNGGLAVGVTNTMTTTSQTVTAGTTGFINGTTIVVPPQGLQIGTTFEWTIPVAKSAGTVVQFGVRFGTANTFAGDTTNVALTPSITGTAVADNGMLTIRLEIIGPLGTSCAALATFELRRGLVTTGWATTAAAVAPQVMTMATFNSGSTNPGPAFFNVAVTASTGTAFVANLPITANVLKTANP